MNKTNLFIFIIQLFCTVCFAQSNNIFSEKAMYDCYLGSDKKLWKQYIVTANFEQMSNKERQRLLNYEYGYIAYAISLKDNNLKQMLQDFVEHINFMEGKMAESTRLTYLSAAASYNISTNKIAIVSNGMKAISYADKAVQIDSLNPYALTLRGSIYFYCPSTFGGDKKQALKYLLKSEQRFRQTGDTINNWNYRSVQMVIAQCHEKLGNKKKAIEKCQEILKEEPNFAYIRDSYLPSLLGTKPQDDSQNIGVSFVSGISGN